MNLDENFILLNRAAGFVNPTATPDPAIAPQKLEDGDIISPVVVSRHEHDAHVRRADIHIDDNKTGIDNPLSAITKQTALDLGREETSFSLKNDDLWQELYGEFVTLCQNTFTIEELTRANEKVRQRAQVLIDQLFDKVKAGIATGRVMDFSEGQQARYRQLLIGYTFGLGPLDYLFNDSRQVTDIHIVSSDEVDAQGRPICRVFVAHSQGVSEENVRIDPYVMLDMLRRQLGITVGRSPTTATPIVDGRLLNGARVNISIYPACETFMNVSIRIPNRSASRMEFLLEKGFITVPAASFLFLCVRAKLNIVIAGSTGTGKTTLLNALCKFSRPDDRIVSIEDTHELNPSRTNYVALLTVVNHRGEVSIPQTLLVKNALRMMPDRIILGEVRDGAAWDAIHAASTGHRGTMLTVHSDDEESIFTRLRTLCEMGGATLSPSSLMEQIGRTIQLGIYIERKRDSQGRQHRYISSIIESNGLFRDGKLNIQPYFKRDGDQLRWQNYMPHTNIMNRFLEGNITQDIIRHALNSPVPIWEDPEMQKLGG